MAAVAHAATLEARIPFLHFFDGFRTSHEVAKIEELSDGDLRELIPESSIYAHRRRGLTPDRPVLRGTAQNRVGIQTAGMNVHRVDEVAFGIGVAMAATGCWLILSGMAWAC